MPKKNSFAAVTVLFCLLSFCISTAWAEEVASPPQIAVLPFTVHAAEDMSYIQNGLRDMVAIRLASRVGAKIISSSLVDQAVAGNVDLQSPAAVRSLGTALQADYVLSGSLTSFAGATSIDAVFTPVQGGGEAQSFSVSSAKESELIAAINTLTWDIAEQAFEKKRPAFLQPQAEAAPAAAPTPPPSPYQTSHPDRLYTGSYNGIAGGQLIRPLGVITSPMGFTKSQDLAFGLVSMAVSDLDGDGQDEIVLASKEEVRIYRQFEGKLQQVAKFETPYNRYSIHAVTAADINNNGINEIFVSIADTKDPLSFVVEWDGKGFQKIASDLKWYIRALEIPGEGAVLVGQKSSMNTLLAKSIYRLTLSGSEVIKGERLEVQGVNLFDFILADIDADGRNEMLALSQGDRLLVMRPSGKVLWTSDEYYGGTTTFIGGESIDDIAGNLEHGTKVPRITIPARIIVRDVNKDGQLDVIVKQSSSTASRLMDRYRSYPSGDIRALTWNGIGLTELWRTRKIDGYIADYDLGPIRSVAVADKDGMTQEKSMADLHVALVLSSGGLDILSNSRSTVLTFPIEIVPAEQ